MKYSDYRKMVYIQSNSDHHLSNQVFKEWKRRTTYKKTALINYLTIKKRNEELMFKRYGNLWLARTKLIIQNVLDLSRALIDLRKIYLRKYIGAWKYLIKRKKVPELFQEKKRQLANIQIFNVLKNWVLLNRRFKSVGLVIQKKSENKLKNWIFKEMKNAKVKQKLGQNKEYAVYLMTKRKFLTLWVDNYNMRKATLSLIK